MRKILGKGFLAEYTKGLQEIKDAEKAKEQPSFTFIDQRKNNYTYTTKKMVDRLKADIQDKVEWKHFESYQGQMNDGKRFTVQELKEMGGRFHNPSIKNQIMQYGLKTAIEDIKNQHQIKNLIKDNLMKHLAGEA